MKAVLVFPGAIDAPTGGYVYDRMLLEALPTQGVAITPLSLPEAFPFPEPADVEEAARLLSQTPPDAVLFIDGLALGALPTTVLRAAGRPIVALIHHPLAREAGLTVEQSRAFAESERAALAACDGVIATSAATGRDLVAHYGVPEDRLAIAEPGVAPAPRAAAVGDPPRLLAIGSVIPRKNYAGLVDALAQVKHLPWHLSIIGSLTFAPGTVEDVRARIAHHGLEDRIALKGAVPVAALDAAYAACDLFVHPSLYEGYGMVLADALRRGLPMICTTGGAAGDTVPDGAALKIPPGDTAALTDALRTLLARPEARRELAEVAYGVGHTLPTWADTATRAAAVLGRVYRKSIP
ncbi:glycosyl transferase family 1 [Azorhizobium oxalatiphilum]|uniref:Glycosyl transferase family 1 n=1 Tax=Azorhizobium oxalatiphilum TaxID=980631 RepID=A0A917BIB2_9HYPH|nr:glycosyltransferase family 4 protein [Azorhizobium oxalatiphilum]GGF46640.1 glycosyl transferase family 1 [Azorhizobium oxalatiphilum]